nr:hypothetical protein [Tanacetum cinerariifolium]
MLGVFAGKCGLSRGSGVEVVEWRENRRVAVVESWRENRAIKEHMGDSEWSRPACFKLARENLQSRVKEEDSVIDVKNAVFDL